KFAIELLATVEPFEKADLAAQVQGEVKGLDYAQVDIGKSVTKDQVLVTLDVPALRAELTTKDANRTLAENLKDQAEKARDVAKREVQEARKQVARYWADLEFRDLQYKRVIDLVSRGTVQRQNQEEAKMQRNAARAAWEAAEAQVLTKEAKLATAEAE